MSITAVELFNAEIVRSTLNKLRSQSFSDIKTVRFWLRKAKELIDNQESTWENLDMTMDSWQTMLCSTYRRHLHHVHKMRELVNQALEQRDPDIIEDAELLQGVIDEIRNQSITENELGRSIQELENKIYWIYNGHTRDEDPSILAPTG
jgi:membrane-associated HD superfamily phosphohydrolase